MFRILIIEDNGKLADLIGQSLQRKGMEVHIVPDGESGLRAFESAAYDVLLVDVNLPVMKGDEVCRKVRAAERGKNIPLIMMSGVVTDDTWIAKIKQELGLTGFLIKPFPSESLFSVIMTALPSSEAGPQSESTMPAAMRGDLGRTPFEQVLLYLLLKRATGTLQIGQGPSTRTFSFIGGSPC